MNQINQQSQAKKKQKIIGEYAIGKTIGIGTFASVRQATHLRTNQKVSIKILNKKMIEETRDKINISRQMRILKKIRHPNIAQLLQIMQTNSRIYFVMELVQGGELYSKITSSQKGRLEQAQAATIFQQLLNAIQYLHQIGIAHRDIKPENILLDQNNNVKVIDFGLSTFYQKNQKLKTSCGSPCYAAPEMLVQEPYNPLLSDIWSLGIVLYAMICGYLPFEDKQTKILYQKIKIGYYQQPSFLSSQAKSIIAQILKLKPENRPSIQKIRQHIFFLPKQKIVRGLLPSENIKIEEDLILELNRLGYYGFRSDIQSHKHTEVTTAYYLLLYKKLEKQKQSLQNYYMRLSQQTRVHSPYRSKSLVLKKIEKISKFPKEQRKSTVLKQHTSRYEKNNQEQGDFLDRLIQKNIAKMRQRSASVRIRKLIV